SIYRSRLFKRNEDLSEDAWRDILDFFDEVEAYFNRLMGARSRSPGATEVRSLVRASKPIRSLAKEMRNRHLDRLKAGNCHAVTAQTFSDMFMSLQRIKNHTINYVEAYAGL